MFDYSHYVPILKGKQGEFKALRNLRRTIKDNLTPIIDIPPIDEKDKPQKTLDVHLTKNVQELTKAWDFNRSIFIDIFQINISERIPSSNEHPLLYLFNSLRRAKIHAIPVTGFDRDPDYDLAIEEIVKQDARGVCVRILEHDMHDAQHLEQTLDKYRASIGLGYEDVHLLIDLRVLESKDVQSVFKKIMTVINSLKATRKVKTLMVAASGFPDFLTEVPPNSCVRIPRTEVSLYENLIKNSQSMTRIPTFADYGICHPDLPDLPAIINASASIRYTLEKDWMILKGKSLRKEPKFKQFHDLSAGLLQKREYRGASYNWGDRYIFDCGHRVEGSGNLTTWRAVGTNHHMTLTCSQIMATDIP